MTNRASTTSPALDAFRVLDLFSGAGGFSVGLDQLESFTTVLANDIMPEALETFSKNFPHAETIQGDISSDEVRSKVISRAKSLRVNMIIGGPPCQGFSNKGKKLGLKDPRNFLFIQFLKVVESVKPEVFVIENVKAMATSTNGWFMQQILEEVERLGYFVSYGTLTASDFGVPQTRQRTVIIASRQCIVPLPERSKPGYVLSVREAISDLAFLSSGQGLDCSDYPIKAQSKYQAEMRKGSKKLYNHKATNHSPIALMKLQLIPAQMGKESLPEALLGNQKFKTTWGRLKWDLPSPTIDTRFDTPSNGTNSHPELHRSITPREAARLQSFPDRFRFFGSKTSICKQIGNAVPPKLGTAIGSAILGAYRV